MVTARQTQMNPQKPAVVAARPAPGGMILPAAVLGIFALASAICRAEDTTVDPRALLKLSVDELLNVRVTTVSREASTIGQSPAAVTVITPEMIHRSGAATFPELLRMVPGMNVAHIDSNKWAVGSRGFAEIGRAHV